MIIQMNWEGCSGGIDTKKLKLISLPRGLRASDNDKSDAELCMVLFENKCVIAEIHLGDVGSSNALCAEIARRFNEFPEELKK